MPSSPFGNRHHPWSMPSSPSGLSPVKPDRGSDRFIPSRAGARWHIDFDLIYEKGQGRSPSKPNNNQQNTNQANTPQTNQQQQQQSPQQSSSSSGQNRKTRDMGENWAR
uniref:Uncharacterized protein n=1 Tax=Ciona savignyi TaxID=51511 RepID=H2YPL3_CIOSA